MIAAAPQQWQSFYSNHLKRFRRTNDRQAEALCPLHEDNHPSFSINLEQGLWKCHAGCGEGNGLTFADLMGLSRNEVPGWIPAEEFGNNWDEAYPYKDEAGVLLYQVLRYPDKKFLQRRPDGKSDWFWHLDDTRRVLYRLPELLEAKKTESTIFIVEGEKDVETLRKYCFTATCNPMGAGKWRDDYSESLRGFQDAVIIADKDKEGRAHAQAVAKSVSKVIGRVKVVEVREVR